MGISCEEIIHFSDFYMGDQSQKKKGLKTFIQKMGSPTLYLRLNLNVQH